MVRSEVDFAIKRDLGITRNQEHLALEFLRTQFTRDLVVKVHFAEVLRVVIEHRSFRSVADDNHRVSHLLSVAEFPDGVHADAQQSKRVAVADVRREDDDVCFRDDRSGRRRRDVVRRVEQKVVAVLVENIEHLLGRRAVLFTGDLGVVVRTQDAHAVAGGAEPCVDGLPVSLDLLDDCFELLNRDGFADLFSETSTCGARSGVEVGAVDQRSRVIGQDGRRVDHCGGRGGGTLDSDVDDDEVRAFVGQLALVSAAGLRSLVPRVDLGLRRNRCDLLLAQVRRLRVLVEGLQECVPEGLEPHGGDRTEFLCDRRFHLGRCCRSRIGRGSTRDRSQLGLLGAGLDETGHPCWGVGLRHCSSFLSGWT